MNPAKKHPNTTVAAIASLGVGSLVVQFAHKLFGWNLTAQDGLWIAGGLATVALFIGHNGAVGTWAIVKKYVLHGTASAKPKKK